MPLQNLRLAILLACLSLAGLPLVARAADCPVNRDQLTQAIRGSVKASGGPTNGGFDNNEWAVVEAPDGTICAVTFSGGAVQDQWPASRGIAAAKANTALGVSLKTFAFSTANLYAGAQPAGPLYGMQAANPVAADVLYAGNPSQYGTAQDPMLGKHVGGAIAFGGGLALYDQGGLVGALGVSGDTSCADHNVAWRVRHALGLDHVPGGVSPDHNDAIIYDIMPDKTSVSGYGHASCKGKEADVAEQIHAGIVPDWQKQTQ